MKKVMIIEDCKGLQFGYRMSLRDEVNLVQAHTLAEATRLFEEHDGKFDIITFDGKLDSDESPFPEFTFKLIEDIRAIYGGIMVGASSDPKMRQDQFDLGCNYIIEEKNLLPKKVLEIIEELKLQELAGNA
ncbi:MAG: hypothetical protein PHS92_03830 [Candidatus Gracilibacteria bacterium]|nr:hypothetical protein [Candidatus Gracilibacteria bacterium]